MKAAAMTSDNVTLLLTPPLVTVTGCSVQMRVRHSTWSAWSPVTLSVLHRVSAHQPHLLDAGQRRVNMSYLVTQHHTAQSW